MKTYNDAKPLGFVWETQDPFLYCVHHYDEYPESNSEMGPKASLEGRTLGEDFDIQNKWKMYHGREIPGFPEHPHRGFETVTIVLEGFVDHFDSGGASGRYGNGDVQWMTAGSGLQHAEMFPLIYENQSNTLHLFQIWLNLPAQDKFVKPHYKMLWAEDIPNVSYKDKNGLESIVTVIAGTFDGERAPSPAPDSWAADPEHHFAIWIVKMEPHATLNISAKGWTNSPMLYFYKGKELRLDQEKLEVNRSVKINLTEEIRIHNGDEEAYFLWLQSDPINEPVYQYGPFVMSTEEQIREAYRDFRETRFGGWPWPKSDPVHPKSTGRHATYSDGRVEKP